MTYPASAASLVLALGVSTACGNAFDVDTEGFVIAVDSISVPDTIAAGDVLTAHFYGMVGPNQCYRLGRVERGRGPGLLEVRFHGERTGTGDCLQMPAVLDHTEEVSPPMEDSFRV